MPMTARRKKRLTYIAIGGLFLLSAIEYGKQRPPVAMPWPFDYVTMTQAMIYTWLSVHGKLRADTSGIL